MKLSRICAPSSSSIPLEVNATVMADWAHLQTDILGTIIRKLAIPDYLRFRAVCTSWNLVCRDVCHRPRIDPWLMLPSNPVDGAKFFSVPERNNQIIHLRSTMTIIGSLWAPMGSSHGWLIYYNSSYGSMQLLNPISGAQIQLPTIVREVFSRAVLIEVNERGCTVALIYSSRNGYAVTRTGYSAWSSVQSQHRLVDVMKHNGQLYTIDIYGTVELWAEPRRVWPDEEIPQMHDLHHHPHHYHHQGHLNRLVETPAGDLMRVKRQSHNMFSVWVLDKETFTWAKVDDMGEMAVFVSHINSVCFPIRDHPRLRANCIYFIDDYKNLCMFNLEHKAKELVETLGTAHLGRGRETYLWFIPSLK